ncbi:transcription termination factor MTERF6, chloroplastic/mitochondrial-like [Telopea speciosissima]|uniref:transcription termination factor MTERF6, chloroplastic/mitochondrial-like n=1 Tax=Telopea speciosissima TaxID=54955 RepID=UPI001CC809CE|nr:transcription termination factor MTERF6, chloroplastic/mitochondrial-like [Telopea speciosissima]
MGDMDATEKRNHGQEENLTPETETIANPICFWILASFCGTKDPQHRDHRETGLFVIELLQTNGFTNTHIANLITKYPPLLFADPVKTLKPKLELFQSLGFSRADLAKFLSSNNDILLRSLQNQIIPTCNFLKTFIHTNANLITALKQFSRIVGCNVKRTMEPNIATLRSYGVPDSNISKMIFIQPNPLTLTILRFKDVAAMVNKMGFNPNSLSFIIAICCMSGLSKQTWERKREVFKSFGWSDDEFLLAFKVQSRIMLTSEKKLGKLMDFFVNVLHLKPSDVVKCPNLFLLSLERRIIPRCSVLQILMSKGLIKNDVNIVSVLNSNKMRFEKRYFTRYEGKAPEVIKAYEGEMEFLGFDS